MRRLIAVLSLAVASGASAQGRLVARPCLQPVAPPCPPNADCALPRVRPCGVVLERTSSDVKVALANRVLRYEISETFVNRGSSMGEADYVFPLPAGAAFEDLKLSINGELVSGETMSADKARGIYEDIVRRQRDPALVEWMGCGLLRARIFPIQPGEEKKVVVRFQSVAQREGDALRIDYRRGSDPNATGGRTPRRSDTPLIDAETTGWSRFALMYEPGPNYGEPYSPTHSLRTRDDGRVRRVEASGSASELTILLPLRRPDAASLSVLAHAPTGERGFALITVTPPSVARRAMPRDLTFVVDASGSMRGRKLEQAKAAGRALFESLRPEDRFRLVDFSTDIRSFREEWTSATRANVRDALRYLDDVRADGSTNISGALDAALAVRSSDGRLPLVVFVTDGEPTVGERNADAIAAMASRLRGDARIFAVGVSAEVNAGLIEQLALEGHGTAHFVRDDESVERTVSLLARRLTTPVLTNVRLHAEGVRLTQMLPQAPLDVFAGQDLVLLARYEGSGNATLRLDGASVDGAVSWSTRVSFPEHERDNPFVARLWAAQRIGWLAAEKRKQGGSSEMDGEIRSLGERYGIPTEFSSYLVVEPGMQTVNGPPPGSPRMDGLSMRDERLRRPTSAPQPSIAAAVSGAAKASNEVQFEAARTRAEQREVKSLASLDANDALPTSRRRIGERLFTLANGVWTDARYVTTLKAVRVRPYSSAYFDLVKRLDGIASVFALGDRLVVAGRSVAIELAADGVERLTSSELDALARGW